MKTSETIDALSKSFVDAQADLKNATFDKINPHFKNKYATLAGMRDSLVPALAKHGLAVIQGTCETSTGFTVTTRMVHSSGQWIESAYPFSVSEPQKMGSAYTYARRYSLAAICGIASEEDDDGNSTQNKAHAPNIPLEMIGVNGQHGASKAANRDGYNKMVKEIRDAVSVFKLDEWYKANVTALDAMSPDWVDELRVEFSDKKSELKEKAAS